MEKVKAKKHLGQHFLVDENIAKKIAQTLQTSSDYNQILEIGPGMGVLTKYLLELYPKTTTEVIEIDQESVAYLNKVYPLLKVHNEDFLKCNLSELFNNSFALIGNYPYNISSQIVFKMIENRNQIPIMSGMFQKEVAERICAEPGSKTYGITSILTQAFYDAEYLFTVSENVFSPPPKVKSGVLRLTRKKEEPACDPKILFQVVKQAFNQRRKTMRNSVRGLFPEELLKTDLFSKRPEQLSVQEFIVLATQTI